MRTKNFHPPEAQTRLDSHLAEQSGFSRSRIAELLSGRRAGDKVELPTEDENVVEVTITAVNPLPQAIVDWANNR